jgi:hypothetical protein
VRCAIVVIACAGCAGQLDPSWELDHDRIVAVRATPPHVSAGEVAVLDALVAHAGAPTDVEQPIAVAAPTELAPGGAGSPVQLEIEAQFPPSNGHQLVAVKTVWFGDHQENPTLGAVTVGGVVPDATIGVPVDVDVALTIDLPAGSSVCWLTSLGTLQFDDEPTAILHVAHGDAGSGELAVVVRDATGGVAWQVWPMTVR